MEAKALRDKIPPFNDDAEKAVLGSIMLDPGAISEVIRLVRPDDFYRTENQKVLQVMLDLYNDGSRIDLISVTETLKTRGELDLCGGPVYISALTDAVPTAANVAYYATLVQDSSFRRTILITAGSLTKDAHDDTLDSRELVESAEQQIFNLANKQKVNDIKPIKSLIPGAIKQIETLYSNKGATVGVPTGFSKLDEMTQGFQKQDFIIIGARPSIGKTAFALSMAGNIAVKQKIPIGIFSLEMGAELLVQRMLASESKVDSQKIRSGFISHNSDFQKLTDAASRLYEAPLYIDDTPNIRLLDLRANARRMVKEYGIRALFIDYIGLIGAERTANVPRHEQVGEISRSLKALARELDIPIVCLAQVGRQSEGAAPQLNDLRDSGSIEQDADIVMFLHRERDAMKSAEEAEHEDNQSIETDLVVAKYRNGPTGMVKINFIKRYTLFTDMAGGSGRP